jgi:hypothetical protein
MELTPEKLKELVLQVLEDMNLILPLPLQAEPTSPGQEPPEIIQETVEEKLFSVLQRMKETQRKSLFARFGYVKRNELSAEMTQSILKNISNINRAQKGDL